MGKTKMKVEDKPMTLEQAIKDVESQSQWLTGRQFLAWDFIKANLAREKAQCDYAERLARLLWKRRYAKDAPQWEPMSGDLYGILSQIDNMLCCIDAREPVRVTDAFERECAAMSDKYASLPIAAKVPDEITTHDSGGFAGMDERERGYVEGWNACREAMLAQGNDK
jgi:hypothetical protein